MMWKLSVGLLAILGVPALVATVLAQQPYPSQRYSDSQRSRSADSVTTSSSEAVIAEYPVQERRSPLLGRQDSTATTISGVHSISVPRGDFYFAPMGLTNEETNFAREADELARKLGEAKSDTDRAKLKDGIGQVLEKQFDLRQKRHLDEIKSLEAKIKKLKELVDKRQENRREIVSKRLDQILSDAEGLGW